MEVLIQNATGYFPWDWPWMVVSLMAVCTIMMNALQLLSEFKLDEFPGISLITAFVLLVPFFIIPLAIPVMASLGNDFWSPLIILFLLYVLYSLGSNEGFMGSTYHFLALVVMTLLAVIIRVAIYFFS